MVRGIAGKLSPPQAERLRAFATDDWLKMVIDDRSLITPKDMELVVLSREEYKYLIDAREHAVAMAAHFTYSESDIQPHNPFRPVTGPLLPALCRGYSLSSFVSAASAGRTTAR